MWWVVLERAFAALLVPPHQDPNQVLLGFRVPLTSVGGLTWPPTLFDAQLTGVSKDFSNLFGIAGAVPDDRFPAHFKHTSAQGVSLKRWL